MVKRKLVKVIYSSSLPDTPTRQCKRRQTKLGERCCVTLTLISKLAFGDLVQSCQEKKSIVWRFVAVRVVMVSSVEACQSGCVVRFPSIQQPISSIHLPCLQRIIERVTALVWKRMQLNSLLNPRDREKMRQRRMRQCKMTHLQQVHLYHSGVGWSMDFIERCMWKIMYTKIELQECMIRIKLF